MFKILKYTKKYLPFIILTPIVLMIEVMLEVKIPRVMAEIVDYGIPSGDVSVVIQLGGKMVLMAIASLCAGMIGCYCASTGCIGFGSELRKAVFGRVQDFSFENVDHFQQSSLLTRLTTDVDFVQQGLRMFTTMFIRAPFMMIMAAIVAYDINSNLFIVFAFATPLLLILIGVLGSVAMPLFKKMLAKYDALNQKEQEYLTNVRVVKSFVREDYEKKKFKDVNYDLMTSSIRIDSLLCLASPIMQMIIGGCIIAVSYMGGKQIIIGSMMAGDLISFIGYIGQILSGLIMMAVIFVMVVRLKGSIDRILEVLNDKINIEDGNYSGEVIDGSIDFENVSFRYEDAAKDSIKNVNLHIEPGQTIGIIGSTGCGKTSLVQLIARLYDATEGQIKVGGRDVKEYKLKTLRDSVAMVLQQNVLFSGSIKDNLRWGNLDASDLEIEEACKYAQAHDFIISFPDGYDTDLGQGGVNVSGGQKQRLCIARALLKKPKIIILDDSTSAVDTHTDAQIREALNKELKDTTTIIIAQRIASVLDADKVVVMDNGEIVDVDTPVNLLHTNMIYQQIYHTQMEGVE